MLPRADAGGMVDSSPKRRRVGALLAVGKSIRASRT